MLDKIKSFATGLGNVLLYVVAPLAFIAGFIYHLITKTHELEDELKAKDGQEKLNELQGEQKSIDADADDVTRSYEQLRDAFLHGRDQGSGQSDSGEKPADSDKR